MTTAARFLDGLNEALQAPARVTRPDYASMALDELHWLANEALDAGDLETASVIDDEIEARNREANAYEDRPYSPQRNHW